MAEKGKGKHPLKKKTTAPAGKPSRKKTVLSQGKASRQRKSAEQNRKTAKAENKAGRQKKADRAVVLRAEPKGIDHKQIKKELLARKNNILKEAKQEIAKYISGDTRQLVDTAIDDGDWAVVDISEDISLRMLTNHRKRLREIDEAVRKIDSGTYGICEECAEEISEKRLRIMPAANLCIDCQENKEKLEAVEEAE